VIERANELFFKIRNIFNLYESFDILTKYIRILGLASISIWSRSDRR